ncbi:MAG: energy transducer TonB [Bacteroidetes bacterium]|nr:energy transducer TonB [Bacteroidota bacterium]
MPAPKEKRIRTLDDLVFESRNKDYGCYNLRSTHRRRLMVSMLWALTGFVVFILTVFFIEIQPWNKRFSPSDMVKMDSLSYDHDMVTLLSQLSQIQPDEPLPPRLTLEPNAVEDQEQAIARKRVIPVIELKPVRTETEDTTHKRLVDDLLKKHENQVNRAKSEMSDSLIIMLEKVPEYPGGYLAIQSYFYKNQHYPENALIHGIHGSTVVSFVVKPDGNIDNARVVKGVDPELDMEAIRLIRAMPSWKPAYYKGKPTACMMIMPVDFTIR